MSGMGAIVFEQTKSAVKRWLPLPILRPTRHFLAFWRSFGYADTKKAQEAVHDVSPDWRERIEDVVSCPDNAYIPRVPDAGQLRDGLVTMHNGIKVNALGYYGAGIMNMLIENKGVHEPQEERAFGEVLQHLPAESVMLELGAYWGFYSIWFAKHVPRSQCFLMEPHYINLRSGRMNFKRAGCDATFEQAYIGALDGRESDGTPVVTIDSFCARSGIERLTILHADVQGAELDMLHGAKIMLSGKKIDFCFVSTHSNDLHYGCIDLLRQHGYEIMVSADLTETYSVDGLIVAKCNAIELPRTLSITKKTQQLPTHEG